MSDLFGNHIVGFSTRRLISFSVQETKVSGHISISIHEWKATLGAHILSIKM